MPVDGFNGGIFFLELQCKGGREVIVDDSNYRDVLSTLRNEIARDLWWVLASIPMLHDVPQFPQHTEGNSGIFVGHYTRLFVR